VLYSGVGSENGRVQDRANSFQRPNNFGRHAGEVMPFGFRPEFMHQWHLPQAYNPYATSCSRLPGSAQTFEPLPTYGEESTSSHEVISKEESSNSPSDRSVCSSSRSRSVFIWEADTIPTDAIPTYDRVRALGTGLVVGLGLVTLL